MTDKTVAKRYAKALFAIGEEQGKTEVFAENLSELSALLKESKELASMLTIQSIENRQKKEVMKSVLKDMDPMILNFALLSGRQRSRRIPWCNVRNISEPDGRSCQCGSGCGKIRCASFGKADFPN